MPRRPYHVGRCDNCGDDRLLKYAKRTMCCRYRCQKAAAALRRAGVGEVEDEDDTVPTFCYEVKEILGQRFADPDALQGGKKRKALATESICLMYIVRGRFAEDVQEDGFGDARWVASLRSWSTRSTNGRWMERCRSGGRRRRPRPINWQRTCVHRPTPECAIDHESSPHG